MNKCKHFSSLVLLFLAGLSSGMLAFSVSAENNASARIIQISPNGQDQAYSVAYSPDKKTLAVGSTLGINLYNSKDLSPIRSIPTVTWVRALAYSPDGSLLASGSYDPVVRLWRTNDGTLFKELKGHTGWVRSLAFSPNGDLLATASDDNTVRVWSIPKGESLYTFTLGLEGIRAVAFSPDGTMLATGGFDNIIRLWQVSDGTLLRELKGSTGWIRTLAFSPKGEWLASGGFDHLVHLWRVTDGELLVSRDEHSSSITGLAFSPDGELLASADVDTTVRLWKMPTLEPYDMLIGHTDFVFSVDFSPDGKSLASGAADNTVRIWDVPVEANPVAQDYVSSPSTCQTCHHPQGNYLQVGGLSQPPRVIDVGCSSCHLGGTLVLNWCPAFPRASGPLTPVVVSSLTSNKIGVPRGNKELSIEISTPGNSEHFYAPSIIAALPIDGQVYYSGGISKDIEVYLEIWSGPEKIAELITTPQPDGYFSFNTYLSTGNTELKMPIEQRTCNACHSENLGNKTLIPPGEVHLIVKAIIPDGTQATDERWINVDQSNSAEVVVHVELENNNQPTSGLPVVATTRLYEWQGRSFTSLTDTSGVANLQVEALSEAPTKYTLRVPSTVVNGLLYESFEPVEITLSPGATITSAIKLQVHVVTGTIKGLVTGLDTPVRVWAISLPDGGAYSVTTSSQGEFAFTGLPVIQYMLVADPQELAKQGLVLSGETIDLSQSLSTQLNLIPKPLEGVSLTGKITDESGTLIPFAWMSVDAQIVQTNPGSETTSLNGLSAGNTTVILNAPGYYSQAQLINLKSASASLMSFSLVRQPGTKIIPWGDGTIVIPQETVSSVDGQQITFEQGWLWGTGESEQPITIKWGEMNITISGGKFALERLPASSAWLYILDGQASINQAGSTGVISIDAGEMVLLNQGQELHPVTYYPEVVGALRLNGEVPIVPTWQPSLSAQVRDRMARIGIGTVQIVTFITYFVEVLALLAIPFLGVNWVIQKKKKEKKRD